MRIVVACLILLAVAGCGRERPSAQPPSEPAAEDPLGAFDEEEIRGRVRVDGSSTVGPLMSLAAERFRQEQPRVRVSVGVSGTGGGFERFCAGETDLSNASRPIKEEEKELCESNGIGWLELQVANDGISLVVNNENTWAECLTVEQLKAIWQPGSDLDSWREIDPRFPDEDLKLYGAGTDSGTFDYFTDAIVGEEGASRSDYSASEDDNVIARGVSGDDGALGYFGLSYLLANEGRLKGVPVDAGDGCVMPSIETVQSGEYKPLSRPLFTYVREDALVDNPAVEPFLTFLLDNEPDLATGSKYVPMTEQQLERARTTLEAGGIDVE